MHVARKGGVHAIKAAHEKAAFAGRLFCLRHAPVGTSVSSPLGLERLHRRGRGLAVAMIRPCLHNRPAALDHRRAIVRTFDTTELVRQRALGDFAVNAIVSAPRPERRPPTVRRTHVAGGAQALHPAGVARDRATTAPEEHERAGADRLEGFKQSERLPRQRHVVGLAHLHPALRDRPQRLVEVDLIPTRRPRLGKPGSGQRDELDAPRAHRIAGAQFDHGGWSVSPGQHRMVLILFVLWPLRNDVLLNVPCRDVARRSPAVGDGAVEHGLDPRHGSPRGDMIAAVENRRDDLLDVLDRYFVDVELGEALSVTMEAALPGRE